MATLEALTASEATLCTCAEKLLRRGIGVAILVEEEPLGTDFLVTAGESCLLVCSTPEVATLVGEAFPDSWKVKPTQGGYPCVRVPLPKEKVFAKLSHAAA